MALDLEFTRSGSLDPIATVRVIMKIGELARRTGLSAHTLRYYERIGLIPYADRDRSGLRDYDAAVLAWIAFLGRLKTTGMSIRDMQRYAALRAQGSDTEAERLHLLKQHRSRLIGRIADLQADLALLDDKIAGYIDAHPRRPDHE